MATEQDYWNQMYANACDQNEVLSLRQQLETERMRLAACGCVAMANIPESAAKTREMLPQYRSASCDDVAAAVDREMSLRQPKMKEVKMECFLIDGELIWRDENQSVLPHWIRQPQYDKIAVVPT